MYKVLKHTKYNNNNNNTKISQPDKKIHKNLYICWQQKLKKKQKKNYNKIKNML